MPFNIAYLWDVYAELRNGSDVIRYIDIVAYNQLTGVTLKPWEISLILDLENIRRR